MFTKSRFRRLRTLLVALTTPLLLVVTAVSFPARASSLQTDLLLFNDSLETSFSRSTLIFQGTNSGPDAAPFSVVPWYYIDIVYPLYLHPAADECFRLADREIGTETFGVCRVDSPAGRQWPVAIHPTIPAEAANMDTYVIQFDGELDDCDQIGLEPHVDSSLVDPHPGSVSIGTGVLSGDCD
jgi:hypothetical protein